MTGLFGGTFDPPHNGHVALLRAARAQLGLDDVVVLVAAAPGHRATHCPAELRLALARLAFPDERVELDGHARTVDLLREERWPDPVFLIGADQLEAFPTWKEPAVVLELARLGVAGRPGTERERLEAVLAQLPRPERVLFFELEPTDVSSSDVRARVARGESIEGLVPPAVAVEVARRGLYGDRTSGGTGLH